MTSFRGKAGPLLDGFPSLHTIESSNQYVLSHLRRVPLPSLSTAHVRNEDFLEWEFMWIFLDSNFLLTCGGNIKTLTIVGTVVESRARTVAEALRTCMRLKELVMDAIDLFRLLSGFRGFDELLHPQVTQLGLTNNALNTLPSENNFHATLIPNLRARFPTLEVLRWLGDVDRGLSRSDTQGGSDLLGSAADTSQVHTSEIRIENRDGEKLELDWLLVR
ncbi:hypothetical protein BD410DRAFT_382374 [Rickenella mellea]|uniref:L domain-like protein n=1 Tax=Rickenella mellea TaxID=50990 RepID=A0A4Y7PXK7_9AGAM|nr:hypothetical protein BD410DRAFT_382374 [Rickenella mellea]